jgi:hypothetical protein
MSKRFTLTGTWDFGISDYNSGICYTHHYEQLPLRLILTVQDDMLSFSLTDYESLFINDNSDDKRITWRGKMRADLVGPISFKDNSNNPWVRISFIGQYYSRYSKHDEIILSKTDYDDANFLTVHIGWPHKRYRGYPGELKEYAIQSEIIYLDKRGMAQWDKMIEYFDRLNIKSEMGVIE